MCIQHNVKVHATLFVPVRELATVRPPLPCTEPCGWMYIATLAVAICLVLARCSTGIVLTPAILCVQMGFGGMPPKKSAGKKAAPKKKATAVKKTAAKKPAAKKPAAKKPVAAAPVVEEPAAEVPAVEAPAAKKSPAKKSPAKKSAKKSPAKKAKK